MWHLLVQKSVYTLYRNQKSQTQSESVILLYPHLTNDVILFQNKVMISRNPTYSDRANPHDSW